MAFLDKLNNFASAAGEKASGAVEIAKLNLRLNTEERKIETATANLGACLLCNLDAGTEYDEAVMAFYTDIKEARSAIATLRSEIAAVSGIILCQSCGAKNPPESKFCRECGTKLLVVAPPEEPPVEILEIETLCPTCSAPIGPEDSFCTQCNTKLN